MSDTEIDILVKGKNEASDALRGAAADVDGLDGAARRTTGPGGGLGGMVGMLGGPVGIAAGVAGAAIVGVGAAAFNMSADMDAAMRLTQQQLGLTEEQAQAMKPAIEDLFVSGLVGSAEEGAAAIAQARQQLKGMSDEELGGAAQQVLMLSNTFGEDYGKTLNTINTLQQQFGLTFDEAANFVTTGFQRGLNTSGDFLDSVGEYSTQFSEAGFGADQFFSIMETGQQGGVLGTDKMSDAMKEFRIITAEGSEDTKEALNAIGIDAAKLYEGMSDGSITSADAFKLVQDGLKGIDDQTLQNNLGVALFGTQWEDATGTAILGVDATKTSIDDMTGATDALTGQTQTLSQQWESTKRELLLALGPIGDELLKLAQEYMPQLKEAGLWLAGFLRDNLPGAIENTRQFFIDLGEGVGVVQGVFNDASIGAQYLMDKIRELRDWLAGLDDTLPDWLRPGSPTPFELGLKGIANEMSDLTRSELPAFQAGLNLDTPLLPDLSAGIVAPGGAGAGVGGNLTIAPVIQGSVISERDMATILLDLIRQMSRQNGGLEAMGITL